MSKSTFNNVKMVAQVVVVPGNEINIYDEAQYYDNNIKRIDRMRKMVGFYKRRVSSEPGVCPTDYAIAAAEKLFSQSGIDRNSIDCLIYMAQRQDFSQPSTCFYVHNKLNLSSECVPFTINHGCAAWAYGMYTAASFIESGAHKRILLLCGDTASIGIEPSNRISAPVFGDAGSATLLEYDPNASPMFFNIETFFFFFQAIISPFSGARGRFDISKTSERTAYLDLLDSRIETDTGYKAGIISGYMDGIAVFDFTIQKVPQNITALMEYANFGETDIKYLCLHQANKQIVQSVATESGFPLDKTPYSAFENYGNNTMNSIPTILNTVLKDNITEPTKIICSGFGNGLTVASIAMTITPDTRFYGVYDWEKPDDYMTREQYIEYWKNKIANTKH